MQTPQPVFVDFEFFLKVLAGVLIFTGIKRVRTKLLRVDRQKLDAIRPVHVQGLASSLTTSR